MTNYIYLASPYTAYNLDGSFDEALMTKRYEAVMQVTAHLAASGLTVYSPIAMSHSMDKYLGRMHPDFWYEFDGPMLESASQLFVLCLNGWRNSQGIKAEIARATTMEIPILKLRSTGLTLTVDN